VNRAIGVMAIASFVLAGCGSVPIVRDTYPTVGTVETRGVGERLLSQGQLVPEAEIHDDIVIGGQRLRKGFYEYEGENSKGIYFYLPGREDLFFVSKATGELCLGGSKGCAPGNYTLRKTLGPGGEGYFQQTLLYNGRIGERITLAYREFVGNLARPAFSNQVEYDLSETNVVGYQGARLEIIEATNTSITYKILSGFDR
jgi:hypothetical protein